MSEQLNHELFDQIYVFRRMIDQLPDNISIQLHEQFNKIIAQYQVLLNEIKPHLSDLSIILNYMQFDLEATRRERDQLKGSNDVSTD